MNLIRIFLIALVLIIIMLLLVKLTAEGNLVTGGEEYDHIEKQIAEIKRENILLKEQIYQNSSLTTIEQRATAMGFVPMGQPIYLPQ